jgi:hypothetical protein
LTEPLSPIAVFQAQSTIAALIYCCLGVWYVYPLLSRQRPDVAMPIALLPFAMRFIGAASMVVGVVAPGYPLDAAWIVFFGDTACAILALIAIGAYRYKLRAAPFFAGLTLAESVSYGAYYVATSDLHAVITHLNAHWYVGTMVVPLLVLNNLLVAALLWKFRGSRTASSASTSR